MAVAMMSGDDGDRGDDHGVRGVRGHPIHNLERSGACRRDSRRADIHHATSDRLARCRFPRTSMRMLPCS
jgi:hypothetical protein